MRISIRAAAAVTVLLVGAALAERATTSFDQLEDGVVALQNALPGERTRAQRRASKVYVKVIQRLSRDTGSLRAELKRGGQILPPLGKLGNAEVDDLVTSAISGLADEIYSTIDAAQQILDGTPAKRSASRDKVQRLLDVARNHIERGVAAVKVKKRIAFLRRAEAKARKALALAPSVPPREPGDEGDTCPGRPLEAGESIVITMNDGPGVSYDALGFLTVQEGDAATTAIRLFDCRPDGDRFIDVVLPAPTPPGIYDSTSEDASTSVRIVAGLVDGPETVASTARAELTTVVGRLEMTFTCVLDGTEYSGTVDVDPRP